ncbi:MAG: hypothetical protein ABF648_09345, partial [Propionibacterium sp.]
MTQTPHDDSRTPGTANDPEPGNEFDPGAEQTPEQSDEIEIDLGPAEETPEEDSGINLDFADFSEPDAGESGVEIDLGVLGDTEEGPSDDTAEDTPTDTDEELAKALEELHADRVGIAGGLVGGRPHHRGASRDPPPHRPTGAAL